MKEYNWYKKEVEQKLTKLKTLKPTLEIKQAIEACETLIFEITFKKFFNEKQLIDFNQEFTELKKANFLWKDIIEFSNKIELFYNYNEEYKIKLFSKAQLLELTHDFFKNGTNKELFFIYLKFAEKFNTNFDYVNNCPKNFYADTFFVPYYNEGYIQMNPTYTFSDVATLSHEIGHLIHFKNNYNNNILGKNFVYSEITSTFFDFLTYIYYLKNSDVDLKENVIQNFITFYNAKILYTSSTKKIIKLYLNYYTLLNEKQKILYKDVIGKHNIYENIPYIIGTIISIELINIYLKDPDKAFYLLKNLININLNLNPKQYYKEIQNLGINFNEHVEDFQTNIKRELKL